MMPEPLLPVFFRFPASLTKRLAEYAEARCLSRSAAARMLLLHALHAPPKDWVAFGVAEEMERAERKAKPRKR